MKRYFAVGCVALPSAVVGAAIAFALSCWLYSIDARKWRTFRQKTSVRVAEALRRMGGGGHAVISWVTPSGEPYEASYINLSERDEACLAHLEGLGNAGVVGLSLSGANVTDEGLKHLRNLNELMYLQLDRTSVTDAGMEYLLPLTSLRELDLSFTYVTQRAADYLARLPNLEIVYAEGTALQHVPRATLRRMSPGDSFMDKDPFY